MPRLQGLPWRGAEAPRILILGSFPSETSLALGRYYGFGRNHFWNLIEAALADRALAEGRPAPSFPTSFEERLERLSAEGFALWDVIASCEREGSLDAAIRGEEPNDLISFIAGRPTLERIALNGGKAADSFRRHIAPELARRALSEGRILEWRPASLPGRVILLCRLPSSSPIPTREYRRVEDKVGAWVAFLGASHG